MSFDLEAKRPSEGAADDDRSAIEFMTFLRRAMLAAGVREELVYKKFVSNDHLLVTARESATIAEKLTAWLRGRNLTINVPPLRHRVEIAGQSLADDQRPDTSASGCAGQDLKRESINGD